MIPDLSIGTWAMMAGVYFLPTIFALVINFKNDRGDSGMVSQLEIALFNTGIAWTVVGWLALLTIVWDGWEWWRGE